MSRSYQILPLIVVLFTCVFWAACDAPERTVTTPDTVRERQETKNAYRQEAQNESTGARQLTAVQKTEPRKKDEKRRNLTLQAELEDATEDPKQESSSTPPASPVEHNERDVRAQSGQDAADTPTQENLATSARLMKEQTVQAVQATALSLSRSKIQGKNQALTLRSQYFPQTISARPANPSTVKTMPISIIIPYCESQRSQFQRLALMSILAPTPMSAVFSAVAPCPSAMQSELKS